MCDDIAEVKGQPAAGPVQRNFNDRRHESRRLRNDLKGASPPALADLGPGPIVVAVGTAAPEARCAVTGGSCPWVDWRRL